MPFLLPLFALLSALSPTPTGNISGRVALIKNGTPLADSSNVIVWLEGIHRSGAAPPASRATMKSERKRFTPRVVVVPRRGAVDFPNVDAIYHNVFSVSGANRFDLGLYRAGVSKEKSFEEPGLVRVYCNIHPTMVGFVMVVDSDFAAVTREDGSFRFEGVAAGSHVLKVWHEEGTETPVTVTVRARGVTEVPVQLDISSYKLQPHKNKYGKDYPPPPPDDERY
jgi:plastocyanin